MDDAEFERLYGPWDPFDPPGLRDVLADFGGPWWVVGGWAMELFSGTRRRHEDIDVAIFRKDLPLLLDLARGRYDVWSVGAGALRPITDDWPEPHPDAGQVWLREHARAPWVLDCLLNEDRDGLWVSRREDRAAPLGETTWTTDDGIRVQDPEIVLHHKALQDQPKDRADRDAAWPLLDEGRRGWLREAVLRVYGPDHPWLAWMDEQAT
jgi:hypothetical protein